MVLAVRAVRRADPLLLSRCRALLAVALAQGAVGYTQYALHLPAGLVLVHIVGSVLVWCGALWVHLGVLRSPLLADWSDGRGLAHPAPLGRAVGQQPVTG